MKRFTLLALALAAGSVMAAQPKGDIAKGKEIAVEGKLYTEKWEDKEGNKRSSIKMNVERVHFCGSKSDGDSSGYSGGSDYGDSSGRAPAAKGGIGVEGPEGEDDGDLPF